MTNTVSILFVVLFIGMQISRRLLDFEVPVNSVGINADIRTFDWRVGIPQEFKNSDLACVQRELTGHLFDVVYDGPTMAFVQC